MQRRLAETIPGPSSEALSAVAKKYGVYIIFGLAERDAADKSKVYNAAAVCRPDGRVPMARKIHLPFSEQKWADRGTEPMIFDSPWGPVGLAICTLESGGAGGYTGNISLEYLVQANSVYVVTANLFGLDRSSFFMGGSSLIGPSSRPPEAFRYAGQKFLEPGAAQGTVATATVDLSLTNNSFLAKIWDRQEPDWRPDLYTQWVEKLKKNPPWNK
jgi:predicted amidohydrolase